MEKFREIEVNLQNKINEILDIDTLFDDYVKERNEYDKDVFDSLLNNNAKLSNKINKAIEYIENDMPYLEEPDEEIERCDGTTYMTMKKYDTSILLKILKGE